MMSMKKQAIMLLEEEEVMLSAAAYFQIMKKEKPARKKKSIWMKSRLQRKALYGQYEKLVAKLRGEDTKLQKLHCSTKPKRKMKTGQNRT